MTEEHQPDFSAARAEAKAAAARARALRPWYRKKRFILGIPIAAIVLLAAIGSATNDEAAPASAPVAANTSASVTATAATTKANSGDVHVALAVDSSGEIAPQGNNDKKMRVTLLDIADNITSGNMFMQPDPGKKFFGVQVSVQNVGTAEATLLTWKLRDSTDQEYEPTFLVDGPGTALDPVYNLTPGGKKQGWVYFAIDASAQPKWLRADPNPFLKNDLYFDAR